MIGVSRSQDNKVHFGSLGFDGVRWAMKKEHIDDCYISDPISTFKYLPKTGKFLLASEKSEIQLFDVKTRKALTNPMEFGILSIVDAKTTEDEQFIFFAHSSGSVNMHYIGDNSFTFVTSLQGEFSDACFQKIEVFSKVTKLP